MLESELELDPGSLTTDALFFLPDEPHKPSDVPATATPPVRFNLRTSEDPEHEGCYLSLGHNQLLEDCGFNATAKTFFIIHGWTVSPGEGVPRLCTRSGFLCFGQLKGILVLPDSSLSLPLFLWAACISDSCEECNGHFVEGAVWTPAGWYLMLAHSGLSESGSPEGSSSAPLALKEPSNYT